MNGTIRYGILIELFFILDKNFMVVCRIAQKLINPVAFRKDISIIFIINIINSFFLIYKYVMRCVVVSGVFFLLLYFCYWWFVVAGVYAIAITIVYNDTRTLIIVYHIPPAPANTARSLLRSFFFLRRNSETDLVVWPRIIGYILSFVESLTLSYSQ